LKQPFIVLISDHARMYDVSIFSAASVIEPFFATLSSKAAFALSHCDLSISENPKTGVNLFF
jgi:hypothetical protein